MTRRNPKFQDNKKNVSGKSIGKMRRSEYHRVAMLDIRREIPFKYDIRKIFEDAGVSPESSATIIANIITKGSRVSLKEAKDYTRRMEETEMIEHDTCKKICSLLDQYRKYR